MLVSLVFLSGCGKNEVIEYKHWYNQVVEMQDEKTRLDVFITESTENTYFSIGEQNPVDIGLPYNPQVDAYLNKMMDTLAVEASSTMQDIVLATTTGVYMDNIWYFMLQSYTDTETGNKVINITGICPVHNNNLVVISFGIEDIENNIDTTVIQEMLQGYNIDWEIDDII